ncbi:hypothetical protein V7D15_07050 [Thermoanaerobacter thermohydrosulfuricus]
MEKILSLLLISMLLLTACISVKDNIQDTIKCWIETALRQTAQLSQTTQSVANNPTSKNIQVFPQSRTGSRTCSLQPN